MPVHSIADALFVNSRVLVVAPHPDDETFGCGGTIARAKSLGAEVYVMVVSASNLTHYSSEYKEVGGYPSERVRGRDAHVRSRRHRCALHG